MALPSQEWLARKVASDPDLDCEAAVPSGLPVQISAARADQILCQVVSGEGDKACHVEWKHPDGIIPNEAKSFWFLRSYVVRAIQEAVVWANTQIVIPGTAMHDHYDLLLSLTRGTATMPEQLEAAVLIRKLIEDKHGRAS
jgi:hypothetical protein